LRASHRVRLDRLCAALDESEDEPVRHRSMLRFAAMACRMIREAMVRAGIDPSRAKALRCAEERVAGLVDTPEYRRADAEFRAREKKEIAETGGVGERLNARLDGIGRHYAETGSLPDFEQASLMTLLGWATPPEPASRGAGEGAC
jgi:hypothetical protein